LLFALRPWQGREELLFEALPGVMRQTGLPIVYATMHPEFDLPLAGRLAAEVGGQVAEAHSFSELLGYFAGAQVVCAMRLHALIFAALLGKRSVAISYDPKVDALVEELGIQALELDEELSALAAAIARAAPPQKKQVGSVVERAEVGLELLRALGRELDGTN
jgi:polysaccharide pyruvyl transferase WcaK-like protein